MHLTTVLALAGLAAAAPNTVPFNQRSNPLFARAGGYTGVATFNNYAAQGNTVCGPKSGSGGTYGAAAGDVSPNIGGGVCQGSIDPSKCSGQTPISGYAGPSCNGPNGGQNPTCGKCYTVTNNGPYNSSPGAPVGQPITVQIIDVCPSVSAWNYCKTDVPANERCGDPSTNSLDIDQSAYQALTGTPYSSSSPNLDITITPTAC